MDIRRAVRRGAVEAEVEALAGGVDQGPVDLGVGGEYGEEVRRGRGGGREVGEEEDAAHSFIDFLFTKRAGLLKEGELGSIMVVGVLVIGVDVVSSNQVLNARYSNHAVVRLVFE